MFVTLLILAATPVAATHVRHVHGDDFQNIQDSCDIAWEHINYTNNDAWVTTDELANCANVQAVVRWYMQDLGYVTRYGPQQNLFSSVTSAQIYSILWSRHCGNATCSAPLS